MYGDACTGCGGVENESKRDVAHVRRCPKQVHVCVYNETHHMLNNLITKKNTRVPFYLQPQPHRHVHPHPRPRPHVHAHVHAQARALTLTSTATSNIDSHLTPASEAVLEFTSRPTLLRIPVSIFDGFPRRGRWRAARARCDLKPLSKATRTFHNLGELMLTTALRPSSNCKLCTPSSVTPPRSLHEHSSSPRACATCVERRVEQHTIELVLLQPSCFHTNESRHRSRFSRWLHWS